MDYQRIYNSIISNAKQQNRKKKQGIYYENHHKTPKCMGGNNSKENLVLLTAKEHFICHKLLVEIFPEEKGLVYALGLFIFGNKPNREYKVYSNEYERVRKKLSEANTGKALSEEAKLKLSEFNKGKKIPDEVRRKISETSKGKIVSEETRRKLSEGRVGDKHHMFGKNLSQEHKEKIRKSSLGKEVSEETKRRMSETKKGKNNPWYGKKLSKEHRHRISESHKGRKFTIVKCPYCLKEGGDNVMYKYHFDNCKHNPKNNKEEIEKQRKLNSALKKVNSSKITCPYCNKTGGANVMKRWHFDNCKHKNKV